MGRAEPSRGDAEVGSKALRERGDELLFPVADDDDARRLEAERERLRGQEGAVPVGSLPAHELAARDHEDGAGTAQARVWTTAPVRRDGDVARAEAGPEPPRLAVDDQAQVLGGRGEDPDRACDEALLAALLERAREEEATGQRARVHLQGGAAAHALEDDHRRARGGRRRRRRLRRRAEVRNLRGPRRASELPRGDHERGDHADRHERDDDDVRFDAPVRPLATASLRSAPGAERSLLLGGDVARVVLVDVELPVEAQVLRVGAQEALDVGLRGQDLELLVLERAQVLAPDLGRRLGLDEVDLAAQARLAQAVADLEHGLKCRGPADGAPYWLEKCASARRRSRARDPR